jgi:hypothetical protein
VTPLQILFVKIGICAVDVVFSHTEIVVAAGRTISGMVTYWLELINCKAVPDVYDGTHNGDPTRVPARLFPEISAILLPVPSLN